MQVNISVPEESSMDTIKRYIEEYCLDDENIEREQFIIAKYNNILVGFGRLKDHGDCAELCTLGVVSEYRGKGIGKQLVEALIKRAHSTLYVVCIIPDFFKKFEFEVVADVPDPIHRKYDMCTTKLKVPEPYYRMLRQA
jgi:N-acetylglutamate synthase-like GNAT family acetyltransferase